MAGISIVNSLPWLGLLIKVIVPSRSLTNDVTNERPIPLPSLTLDNDLSTCTNFSNIAACFSIGIPIPVSLIEIVILSFKHYSQC